jgi:hypothetical protein
MTLSRVELSEMVPSSRFMWNSRFSSSKSSPDAVELEVTLASWILK